MLTKVKRWNVFAPVLCCVLKSTGIYEWAQTFILCSFLTRLFERAHLQAHWMYSGWKLRNETNMQYVSSCVSALLMQISANDTQWAISRTKNLSLNLIIAISLMSKLEVDCQYVAFFKRAFYVWLSVSQTFFIVDILTFHSKNSTGGTDYIWVVQFQGM